MTALLASSLDDTSNGVVTVLRPQTWPSTERKKSQLRNWQIRPQLLIYSSTSVIVAVPRSGGRFMHRPSDITCSFRRQASHGDAPGSRVETSAACGEVQQANAIRFRVQAVKITVTRC
jgi:hypothetical protein